MRTLLIILVIWFTVSWIRISNISKSKGENFNPFNGTVIDFLGVLIGGVIMSLILIFLIGTHMP